MPTTRSTALAVTPLWFLALHLNGRSLTFPLHAHSQTLLVAAVLASVALPLVDQTLFVVPAGVGEVFPDGPLEEPFATLTAVHTIVLSWTHTHTQTHIRICMAHLWYDSNLTAMLNSKL